MTSCWPLVLFYFGIYAGIAPVRAKVLKPTGGSIRALTTHLPGSWSAAHSSRPVCSHKA